jgi:hypothetical protein
MDSSGKFEQFYRQRFQEIFGAALQDSDGFGAHIVEEKLSACELMLPESLVDYYVIAGQHYINEEHNRLLPIEEIEWIGDKFVFMEENQCVVFWGIDRSDLNNPDPIVWQGTNGDVIDWYEEKYTLSQFLMEMWRWIVTGEEDSEEQSPPRPIRVL